MGGRPTQGLSIVDVDVMGAAAHSTASGLIPDIADASRALHTVNIFGPVREETTRPLPDSADATNVSLSLAHPDRVSHSFSNNR